MCRRLTSDIDTICSACARLLTKLLLGPLPGMGASAFCSALGGKLSLRLIHVSRSSMDTQLRSRRQTLPPLPVYRTVLEKISRDEGKEGPVHKSKRARKNYQLFVEVKRDGSPVFTWLCALTFCLETAGEQAGRHMRVQVHERI